MTITYKNVFDKVMVYLKNEGKFFTSSEVKTIINQDAFNRIAEEVKFPKTNFSSYLASGEWQVSTPANFICVDPNSQVTYKDGSNTYRVTPKNQVEIGRENVLTATPGTPERYFMDNDTLIGIYPPSTSGCIVVPYVHRPTVMSSDTDSNELTERCYMAAVYFTVAECFNKDSDERAEKYDSKFWSEINRLKGQYNLMYEIRRDVFPHRDYVGKMGAR